MASDSPHDATPTWPDRNQALIACIFRSEDQLTAAAVRLQQEALPLSQMRIGASDAARAGRIAAQLGLSADVDPSDPLRGAAGLGSEAITRKAVDRGALWGATIGALAGLGLSFTSVAAMIPVAHSAVRLALIAFVFVMGTIIGSVLGAAFAPQSSSHAGFRLIDGMQDGGVVLILQTSPQKRDVVQHVLESNGGSGITRL